MKIILKDAITDLWKRDLYTANIDFVIGANIYEYDMVNGGPSLARYYDLLDTKTLDFIKTLSKGEQHRYVGMMQRDDPKFNKALTGSFAKMRKNFFVENAIGEDCVLSIKKDAIFVINRICNELKFGNVEFSLKNRYTSFHRFDKYEFYYRNKGNELAVKGVNNEKLIEHEDYMLAFLKDIFKTLEISDNKRVVDKIKRFASKYKNKELPLGYYRELNADSMYTMTHKDGENLIVKAIEPIKGLDINHRFNYMTYILRLIQRYFFVSGT